MAHFVRTSDGQRVSGKDVVVPLHGNETLGLWGWKQSDGGSLDTRIASTDIVSLGVDLSGAPPGLVRSFDVYGNVLGRTRVSAIDDDDVEQDWFNAVVVSFDIQVTTIRQILERAVSTGQITFQNAESQAMFLKINAGEFVFRGLPVEHSPQLQTALASLIQGGSVQIMRAFSAPNQSLHGVMTNTKWIARAMDVPLYAGMLIHSRQPAQSQILAVCALLRNLPDAKPVGVGFPRPGGHEKFDPSRDVFFSVPDAATAMQCLNGTISRGISQLLEPARTQVQAALAGKNVVVAFPDGADHMHLQFPDDS